MINLKFSVMMCVYGGDDAGFFDEALASVYNQTKKPDEVVLVVDGPVGEDIENVIGKYRNWENLSVYRLEKNMGHGVARQTALSCCTYDYVAIADADDINARDRFEKELDLFAQDESLSVVSTDCYHFADSIENILNEEKFPVSDGEIKKFLKYRCPVCQASVMMKKEAAVQAGGYLDFYHCEDYYLWIRMFLSGAVFKNIPEFLVYVRTNREQINRRGGYKYFKSMKNLYRFMFKSKIINFWEYSFNVLSRFAVQVMMPGKMRAFIRKIVQ